jgi:hypothetical protein
LGTSGHLLGEQSGLDSVEQTLEPADQLRLGDPQLGVGRHRVFGKRKGESFQLVDQLWSEPVLELLDRRPVDLP